MSTHQLPSPPLSDTNASPDFGCSTTASTSAINSRLHLQTNIPLTRSTTVPDQSGMRASFACSHAVNQQFIFSSSTLVYEFQQSNSCGALGSSAMCLTEQMSSTLLMSAEATPKLSFLPNSQTDLVLDTPKLQSSSGWSPPRMLASGDPKAYASNMISTSITYSCERGLWQQSTGISKDYGAITCCVGDGLEVFCTR